MKVLKLGQRFLITTTLVSGVIGSLLMPMAEAQDQLLIEEIIVNS